MTMSLQVGAVFRACVLLGFLAVLSHGAEVPVKWHFGVKHDNLRLKCGDTLRFTWTEGRSHDVVEVPASNFPGVCEWNRWANISALPTPNTLVLAIAHRLVRSHVAEVLRCRLKSTYHVIAVEAIS